MDILFNIAKAQGADEVASPTIPFTPPFVSTTPSVTGTQGPAIMLTSDKTNLKPGDKAKITIKINTRGRDIKSFAFQISFNSSVFRVTDADTATAGKQIKYNDQFFLLETNLVTETATQGTISVKASTTQGSAPVTERTVAEFEVTALKEGTSNFEVTRSGSFLLNLNSVDILESTSGVSLVVSQQAIVTTPPTLSQTPIIQTTITPRTALADDVGGIGAIFVGLLCFSAGIYLWTVKRNAPKLK